MTCLNKQKALSEVNQEVEDVQEEIKETKEFLRKKEQILLNLKQKKNLAKVEATAMANLVLSLNEIEREAIGESRKLFISMVETPIFQTCKINNYS